MRKKFRDLINQANALHSTGPKTPEGKKRSSLNAFKHGLSGNHLVMQQHEFTAYEDLTVKMLRDLKPVTEPEKQIAQKIVDLNFRINRITAIENNLLNFDIGPNEPDFEEDEGISRMMGQARAWKKDTQSFEILGRYESRLSKQLLQYQKELERLQTARTLQNQDLPGAVVSQTQETAPLNRESASFGKPAPAYIMSTNPNPVPTTQTIPAHPNPATQIHA
jgi:hypothetical protein